MENRFDLSWDSYPNDGASAQVAVPTAVDPDEYDELFRAGLRRGGKVSN